MNDSSIYIQSHFNRRFFLAFQSQSFFRLTLFRYNSRFVKMKNLVECVQRHSHTATCFKNDKDICRFHFPRAPRETTEIVSTTSDEAIRNGGRTCLLKCKNNEQFINNYNPTLLNIWQGNMDIQPCGSNEAIAVYIAKYCAKSEPTEMTTSLRDAIKAIMKEEGSTSRKLFKMTMKIFQQRQVSAPECAYRLCHLQLKESSQKCVFLATCKPEDRYKVFKFVNNVATGVCENIFKRYEERPLTHCAYDFDKMSLMEFATLFEPHYEKRATENDEDGDQDAYDQPETKNNS
uniref:Uncharacterized protein n=1 Tax=Strigamia maritima TaxID=126957 RepID=T1J5E9_STRMM